MVSPIRCIFTCSVLLVEFYMSNLKPKKNAHYLNGKACFADDPSLYSDLSAL